MIVQRLLARSSVLRRAQNFNEHGKLENSQSPGRPTSPYNQKETFSPFFFDTHVGLYEKYNRFNRSAKCRARSNPKQTSHVSIKHSSRVATVMQ